MGQIKGNGECLGAAFSSPLPSTRDLMLSCYVMHFSLHSFLSDSPVSESRQRLSVANNGRRSHGDYHRSFRCFPHTQHTDRMSASSSSSSFFALTSSPFPDVYVTVSLSQSRPSLLQLVIGMTGSQMSGGKADVNRVRRQVEYKSVMCVWEQKVVSRSVFLAARQRLGFCLQAINREDRWLVWRVVVVVKILTRLPLLIAC